MSNLLKNNAYHVLGLDTSAEQRDVQRRAKEIVKLLQIGDTPEYDFDLGVFENFRTEETVKEAVQKLTTPKKKIKDYFFWFHTADDVDQEAVTTLRKKDYGEAIQVWKRRAEGDSTKAMFYKKNLAILYCILLFKKDDKQYLEASLKIWHELINSSKFWSAFTKIYRLNDELNTDQETISEFHEHSASFLSDLYTELSHAHGDDGYVAEFTKVFNVRGEKTEKVLLAPIFQEITEVVEKLEEMKVSEDGELDKVEAAQIKEYISKIQECCNKLIDLGLYDDSQSKTIRDRAVAAIRGIVLDIHNNLNEIPKAEQLLRVALQFVGTSGLEHKLKQDLAQFDKNKKDMDRIGPILTLVNEKKFPEAIALIEKEKEADKDPEFVALMNAKKKEAVSFYAVTEYVEAKNAFEAKNWERAIPLYEKAASLIYDNIELFDVNKEVIDSWLGTIKSNVKILTPENADKVDEVHASMLKQLDESFDDKIEQVSIKILLNAYYHIGVAKVIREKKSGGRGWSWLWWIIGLMIFGAIFGN